MVFSKLGGNPCCVLSHISCVGLFATPWTVAYKAPLPLGFLRQVYWNRMPCPPPGYIPRPGIEPVSLTSPALAGRFFTTSTTWEAQGGNLFLSNASWLGSQGENFVPLDYTFFGLGLFFFWAEIYVHTQNLHTQIISTPFNELWVMHIPP